MATIQKPLHAPDNLATLSQDLLDLIISFMGATERLAVFRTCKRLRNAVLSCKQVDTQGPQPQHQSAGTQEQQQQQLQQTRTRLFLAAGNGKIWVNKNLYKWEDSCNAPIEDPYDEYSALRGISGTTASRLLQLAAHSKHDVHVHIRTTSELAACSFQPWLSYLLHPWLMSPPITPSLQHVTSILLQDVKLNHPLPNGIGRACPGLKSYMLCGVSWSTHNPRALDLLSACSRLMRHLGWWLLGATTANSPSIQPWHQLSELTIDNTCDWQPTFPIHPSMLPNLARLVLKSSMEEPGLSTGISIFSKRLTSLEVNMPWDANTFYSQPQTTGQFTRLTSLDLPRAWLRDQGFLGLLKALPALQNLVLKGLHLAENHAVESFNLQQLTIMEMPLNFPPILARIPSLPRLQSLEVLTMTVGQLEISDVLSEAELAQLKHLPGMDISYELVFDHRITEDEEQDFTIQLQALAAFVPIEKLFLTGAHINEYSMRALGAACLPSMQFEACTYEPGSMAFIWSFMPATNDITLGKKIDLDQLQAICLSATRPVTVRSRYLRDEHVQSVQHLLEIVDNKMVTLLRD